MGLDDKSISRRAIPRSRVEREQLAGIRSFPGFVRGALQENQLKSGGRRRKRLRPPILGGYLPAPLSSSFPSVVVPFDSPPALFPALIPLFTFICRNLLGSVVESDATKNQLQSQMISIFIAVKDILSR